MIEVNALTKKYGGFTAVREISMAVQQGEVFGFIGPNGAGKTTTIRMLGGILSPTSGEIRIAGISMARHPEAAKGRIGFIPDRPFLYEKLTGHEFLKFSADLYGLPPERFPVQAADYLAKFALSDWAHELIEAYSHGMKQRLIMAAALLHDPEVIIVDEPMVGLDPKAIRIVRELFRELAGQGKTVFMSTHTLSIAEKVCDRIGVIHRGRLVATGTPRELKTMAAVTEGDLEQVFMRLTEETAVQETE
ncbi:MAG: ABC transporter ATP-binding protein [Desulfobacterales bacterium]